MSNKHFLILLGLLFSGSSAFGQDSLHVRVVDQALDLPIPYATVIGLCGADSVFAMTNLDGTCVLPWSQECTSIEVSTIMYAPVTVVDLQGKTEAEVRMVGHEVITCYGPVIRSYRIYGDIRVGNQLAGNVALLGDPELQRQVKTSLAPALNTEPGVRLDERGLGGSRRISIRGSALRSPFAVRNIKMYVDGIAFTSPDGSSPLEVMDVADTQSLLILKGAAGSIYGPGNGGILLFESRRPVQSSVGHAFTAGSYGLLRAQQDVSIRKGNDYFRLSHTWQENKGYRDQEFNFKNNVLLTGGWSHRDNVQYQLVAAYFDGKWGLPGGIKRSDMESDPTQARAFSFANGTRVERVRTRVGLWRSQQSGNLTNTSSVYVNQTSKINPYGTFSGFNGYKDEGAQGLGGRTVFSWPVLKAAFGEYNLSLGAEGQYESGTLSEWTLENSAPGTFKYDLQTESSSWMAFSRLTVEKERLWVSLSASAAETRYQSQGTSGNDSTAVALDQLFAPGINFLPRLAIAWSQNAMRVHVQGSLGSSPPSLFEMVDPITGQFAPGIKPEGSVNAEVGFVLNPAWSDHLNVRPFGVTAYFSQLNNAILPADEFLFANKGSIDLAGVEAWISHKFDFGSTRASLNLRSAAALQAFTFNNYTSEETSFVGNVLPGVAPATWSNTVDFTYLAGFNLDHVLTIGATHRWTDKMALNDANSDWTDANNLLHAQFSYRLRNHKLEPGFTVGVRNVTNELYSDFLNVNAFGGRYYNPAPDRSFYAGISLRLNLRDL